MSGRCEQLAHCGHARRRLLKRDVRPRSKARSANARGVNASSEARADRYLLAWRNENAGVAAGRRAGWDEASSRLRCGGGTPRGPARCERTDRTRRSVRATHRRAARGAPEEAQSAGAAQARPASDRCVSPLPAAGQPAWDSNFADSSQRLENAGVGPDFAASQCRPARSCMEIEPANVRQ